MKLVVCLRLKLKISVTQQVKRPEVYGLSSNNLLIFWIVWINWHVCIHVFYMTISGFHQIFQKRVYRDQWIRKNNPEIYPCIFNQIIFDRVPKLHNRKRIISSTNYVGKARNTHTRNWTLILYTKINSTCIKDLKVTFFLPLSQLCHTTCGILVPGLGTEPRSTAFKGNTLKDKTKGKQGKASSDWFWQWLFWHDTKGSGEKSKNSQVGLCQTKNLYSKGNSQKAKGNLLNGRKDMQTMYQTRA